MSEYTVGYTESEHYRCLEDLEQMYNLKIMNPLNLSYCGREDCEPGWTFGPRIRENYVIHIVTDGKGVFRVRNTDYELAAGSAFMIFPGEETEYSADDESPWSYMWIGYNGHQAELITEKLGFTREDPVMKYDDVSGISSDIDRILRARELTDANSMKRMAAFFDALSLMMEMNTREIPRDNFSEIRYVNMAVDLIVASYNRKVRIADIADKVGINRSYLTNIFKREMNMSPQTFLINFRLEKAAQLLRETVEPIGSIASAVGYSDALAFSKAFKQKYAITPSEYRSSETTLANRDKRGGYEGACKL